MTKFQIKSARETHPNFEAALAIVQVVEVKMFGIQL